MPAKCRRLTPASSWVSVPWAERVPPLTLRLTTRWRRLRSAGVVIRRRLGFGHEDEEFLDVVLHAPCTSLVSDAAHLRGHRLSEDRVIEGFVNANHEAVVSLVLRGPEGQTREVNAVIDTGYSGFLTLPAALVADLGLPYVLPLDGTDGQPGLLPQRGNQAEQLTPSR